ncbi:hypothetical protein [Nostoc sp.]|uniref:hypothetical protein n=1 Tax=Nostoc sp. TaxID=1180 RepID=UPI002FFB3B4F
MKQSKSTRRRGFVLTIAGLKRLQGAILAMEKVDNNGDRFTLEDLCDRMKVSPFQGLTSSAFLSTITIKLTSIQRNIF